MVDKIVEYCVLTSHIKLYDKCANVNKPVDSFFFFIFFFCKASTEFFHLPQAVDQLKSGALAVEAVAAALVELEVCQLNIVQEEEECTNNYCCFCCV